MNDHFQDYLTMLRVERNVSAHTIDAYKRDLKQYLEHLVSKGIKSLHDIFPRLKNSSKKHLREFCFLDRSAVAL